MRILFTVQGEGRGHLTQAIGMQEILQRHEHEIVGVTLSSNGRVVPDYFHSAFSVPVTPIPSPSLAVAHGRGVSTTATLRRLILEWPRYRHGLRTLRRLVEETRPDLIVNFLEPLTGIYNLLHRPRVPTLVVGHHYMLDHPDFPKAGQFRSQQAGMRAYVSLVAARSARLALSFYPADDLPDRNVFVSPPILRRQLFELPPPVQGDHLLVYVLNHGYVADVIRWHHAHPNIPVHCFHDRPDAPPEEHLTPNLTLHRLHGEKFMRLMLGARGVACTAGFETACEAAYLGKRLLLVPVENHVEQYLNACDAAAAGLATHGHGFSLDPLLTPAIADVSARFQRWVQRAETNVIRAIEAVSGHRPATLGQPELRPGPAPA